MTVTIQLSPEAEKQLHDLAARVGQTPEAYVQQLVESSLTAGLSWLPPGPEDFERLLDELAAGPAVPSLPPDFSRADVYADHD